MTKIRKPSLSDLKRLRKNLLQKKEQYKGRLPAMDYKSLKGIEAAIHNHPDEVRRVSAASVKTIIGKLKI